MRYNSFSKLSRNYSFGTEFVFECHHINDVFYDDIDAALNPIASNVDNLNWIFVSYNFNTGT